MCALLEDVTLKPFDSAAKANKGIEMLIFSGKLNHSIINYKGA